jgi:dienelactone hydrolase
MFPKFILLFAGLVFVGISIPNGRVIADEHNARLKEGFALETPEGQGPFPVVILVPGCSGFKWKFYDRTQAKLVELGFATIRVDPLDARNGSCSNTSVDTAANDIFFAVDHLNGLESIKKNSINLLGWSFGGGVVLQALPKLDQHPEAQLAAVAAYTPRCVPVAPWSREVPVLMLLGSEDDSAPPRHCRELVERGNAADHVTIEEYEGAYHGFDDEDLPAKKMSVGGTLGYHPIAAEKAWNALAAFLVR